MSESAIQREIELAVGALPGVIVMRNNVGVAQHVDERTGKTWRVAYGLGVGTPDLIVFVWPGRVLGLEVKTPKGRIGEEQLRVQRAWRSVAGVPVAFVRSVEDALAVVQCEHEHERRRSGLDGRHVVECQDCGALREPRQAYDGPVLPLDGLT